MGFAGAVGPSGTPLRTQYLWVGSTRDRRAGRLYGTGRERRRGHALRLQRRNDDERANPPRGGDAKPRASVNKTVGRAVEVRKREPSRGVPPDPPRLDRPLPGRWPVLARRPVPPAHHLPASDRRPGIHSPPYTCVGPRFGCPKGEDSVQIPPFAPAVSSDVGRRPTNAGMLTR